jgi:hypothetical protein
VFKGGKNEETKGEGYTNQQVGVGNTKDLELKKRLGNSKQKGIIDWRRYILNFDEIVLHNEHT